MNKGLEATHLKYYSNEIAVAGKLMGDSNAPILPPHTDMVTLANRFSTFFRDKIQHIKANIVVDPSIPPPTEHKHYGPKLASFQPITTSEVMKLIRSTLDPRPGDP